MAITTESPVTQDVAQEDAALAAFQARYGKLGGIERRQFEMRAETDDTGTDAAFKVVGHASVFNKRSMDVGGFTEVIEPGAFDEVLSRKPDVLLLWDHDTSKPLARTTSDKYPLWLDVDSIGLNYAGRVAPTSDAANLQILLDGGIINEASFAFTIAEQRWEETTDAGGNYQLTRYVTKVQDLYDCTVCARGAYSDATSGLSARTYVRSYAMATGAELRDLDPEVDVDTTEDGTEVDPSTSAEFMENMHLYEGDGGPCGTCGEAADDQSHNNVQENSASKASAVRIAKAKAEALALR